MEELSYRRFFQRKSEGKRWVIPRWRSIPASLRVRLWEVFLLIRSVGAGSFTLIYPWAFLELTWHGRRWRKPAETKRRASRLISSEPSCCSRRTHFLFIPSEICLTKDSMSLRSRSFCFRWPDFSF